MGRVTAVLLVVLAEMLVAAAAASASEDAAGKHAGQERAVLDRDSLNQLTKRLLKEHNVPGVAIAVLTPQGAWQRGYGVRQLGRSEPVDSETLFQVGSLSKAFTATALGVLVDRGQLAWDDPVQKQLPEFQLVDPWLSKEVRVKDLLVHRIGFELGAGDLLFWPDGRGSRSDVLAALPHLPLSGRFRDSFTYNNLMYIVASLLIERVSGYPWEDLVESALFVPLKMQGCSATSEQAQALPNRATPHMPVDGALTPTFFSPGQVMSGAGAINCSVADLTQWMAYWVNDGGPSLLQDATKKELLRPLVSLSPRSRRRLEAGTKFQAYAPGWFVSDYRGQLMLEHGGTIHGSSSRMFLLPEAGIGVVVLVNTWSSLTQVLGLTLVDELLEVGESPWRDIFMQSAPQLAADQAQGSEKKLGQQRGRNNSEPQPPEGGALHQYSGRYEDPWYGAVDIEADRNGLRLNMSRSQVLRGSLEWSSNDVFIVHWDDRSLDADAYLRFQRNRLGEVTGATMEAVDSATDFSYDFHHLKLLRNSDEKQVGARKRGS